MARTWDFGNLALNPTPQTRALVFRAWAESSGFGSLGFLIVQEFRAKDARFRAKFRKSGDHFNNLQVGYI